MFIDLSAIIKNDGAQVSFADKIEKSAFDFSLPDVEVGDSVNVEGSVVNVGSVLKLRARIQGKINAKCARCATEVSEDFEIDIDESLMQESISMDVTDEDVIVFSGHSVDLDEIVSNNILVTIPIRYLCKPDCKGLCPVCGKNLNEEQCDCDTTEIDPRLAVLSQLKF